jgi:hypothetical protein
MSEDRFNEIQRSLGRIEGKLDGVRDEQVRQAEYATATSARVGVLERKVASIFAWAAGAGAGAGLVLTVVRDLLWP